MEKVKPTIKGKLVLDSAEDKAFLLYAMRNFKDAVEYAHSLMRKGLKRNKIERILTSRILKNKWYSVSAFKKAKLYRDKPYLKLRRPQLFSVGSENENGNRNIRFDSTNMVRIKIPSTTGRHRWITAKAQFGKEQIPIVNELVNPSFPYSAGVSLKNNEFKLYVNIPLELYVKHMEKKSDAKIVGYIAGFDFNPDRINMVIIDSQGIIRDIQNEDFPEVTSPGFPKEKSETIRREKLAKLVKYARNHGVKYYAVEKLSKPKPEGCRNAKRKISKMALKQFI